MLRARRPCFFPTILLLAIGFSYSEASVTVVGGTPHRTTAWQDGAKHQTEQPACCIEEGRRGGEEDMERGRVDKMDYSAQVVAATVAVERMPAPEGEAVPGTCGYA